MIGKQQSKVGWSSQQIVIGQAVVVAIHQSRREGGGEGGKVKGSRPHIISFHFELLVSF